MTVEQLAEIPAEMKEKLEEIAECFPLVIRKEILLALESAFNLGSVNGIDISKKVMIAEAFKGVSA